MAGASPSQRLSTWDPRVPYGVAAQQIRTTGSRMVYDNAWMAVREDDVVFADGSPGIYGVVDKPDYALIVPFEDGGFHLVEQYRYPVGARFWEFPQGSWSVTEAAPDGDPFALAAAELREETGLRAGRMTYLGRLHVAYGYANQGCHVVLAEQLVPGEPGREASEHDMRQRWVNRSEWLDLVRGGMVSDSASIAAYTLFCLHETSPVTLESR